MKRTKSEMLSCIPRRGRIKHFGSYESRKNVSHRGLSSSSYFCQRLKKRNKKHCLVLIFFFLLYSATFQVIFSLQRNASYSQETMSRKAGFSHGGNLGQVSHY